MTPLQAIEAAADQLGRSVLAANLDVTPGAVSQWLNGGRPTPPNRCPDIERLTGGKVVCEHLRPDARWLRVPDKTWPHPKGRPLLDVAAEAS